MWLGPMGACQRQQTVFLSDTDTVSPTRSARLYGLIGRAVSMAA